VIEGFEQARGCARGPGGLFGRGSEGSSQKPVERPRVVVVELTEAGGVHQRILGRRRWGCTGHVVAVGSYRAKLNTRTNAEDRVGQRVCLQKDTFGEFSVFSKIYLDEVEDTLLPPP